MTDDQNTDANDDGGRASSQTPTAKLAVGGQPPEEIYIDGIAGLSVRASVAKIECYSVSPHEQSRDEPEVRRLSHRIVLPALALNELLQVLQRSQDAIRAAREETAKSENGAD